MSALIAKPKISAKFIESIPALLARDYESVQGSGVKNIQGIRGNSAREFLSNVKKIQNKIWSRFIVSFLTTLARNYEDVDC